MNFLKKYRLKDFNFILVIAVLILSVIGILAVGSALPSAQTKQILGVSFGVIVMLVISVIDFEWVLNFYWIIYAVNILLLLCVEFFGVNYNGAQRWIDLKFTTLQPSDLTKIFLILFFAKFLMNHENRMKDPRTIIKCVLLVAPSLYLIVTQPNLSNTICITAVFYFFFCIEIDTRICFYLYISRQSKSPLSSASTINSAVAKLVAIGIL